MSDITALQMLPETSPRPMGVICNGSVDTRTRTTCNSALTDPSAPCDTSNIPSHLCGD